MARTETTWVLVSDGARARLLRYDGRTGPLSEVDQWHIDSDTPSGREIMSDRPGRSYDSTGSGRHSMEYRSDPRQLEKKAFSKLLIDKLDKDTDQYDRLIIVSSPRSLGDLRNTMPDSLRAKLVAEVDRDLTNMSVEQIEENLGEVIGR